MTLPKPPELAPLLEEVMAAAGDRPIAFVMAGHNGSGKSTLWSERLAPIVELPLINADRLITSILPAPVGDHLIPWAAKLRDKDSRWQTLAQEGVTAFLGLVTEKKMAFGFETVFSHWKERPDGTFESKIDVILSLQAKRYFVVLLFVGLADVELSVARVSTRVQLGGHAVPLNKLYDRFPKTQRAVGYAAPLADMTMMFDNSLGLDRAFTLARVQVKDEVFYDARDPHFSAPPGLRTVAGLWLEQVSGPFLPA